MSVGADFSHTPRCDRVFGQCARGHIQRAAGCKRHDQADGLLLGAKGLGQGGECGRSESCGGQGKGSTLHHGDGIVQKNCVTMFRMVAFLRFLA